MKINEIQCKSILSKSNLPEVDYCINPYVGCCHGCLYCYARFMRRFTNHSEQWGSFVDIKINAPQILERELRRNPPKGEILIGSVTDAYQPFEKKYKITRAILEVLLKHDFPVSILTKSDLIVRDLDLLKQFSNCEIGFTLTSMNEDFAKGFEPFASNPQARITAMKTIHSMGIKTYCFIGPILPCFTDLEQIYSSLQGNVDFIMAETLNMKCGNKKDILTFLSQKYPQCLSFYNNQELEKYRQETEKILNSLSVKFNIPLKGFYNH